MGIFSFFFFFALTVSSEGFLQENAAVMCKDQLKAVAKGPIRRPWPDQFGAKRKRKGFKTKIIQLLSRLRSVKTSQLCDGKV